MKKRLLPFSCRQIAANIAAAAENIRLVIGAANDRSLSGEEWEQITPWGEFPNDKGLQRVTPERGALMVKTFNSMAERMKTGFRGVPIYVGHPDVDPKTYTDHRCYGRLKGMEARTDGLYGKTAWNDLGEQNKAQGYYVYPSPVWYFDRVGGGVIEPSKLASIGLTNTPNIEGVAPWSKNDRELAANKGTSAGALKGWATRRAAGAKGEGNLKAAKVKATMKGKKMSVEEKQARVLKIGRPKTAEEAAEKKRLERGIKTTTRTAGRKKAAAFRALPEAEKEKVVAAKGARSDADISNTDRHQPRATPPPLPKIGTPERAALHSVSSSSGAGTHIHINGPISHEDLRAYYDPAHFAGNSKTFRSVRARRVAMNALRKKQTAA